MLDTVADEIGASTASRVEYVVVYRATSRESAPSASCQKGVADGTCSVYRGVDISSTNVPACGWCPVTRVAGDLVGIWISYRQPSLTGLLPSRRLTSQSVVRIEVPE